MGTVVGIGGFVTLAVCAGYAAASRKIAETLDHLKYRRLRAEGDRAWRRDERRYTIAPFDLAAFRFGDAAISEYGEWLDSLPVAEPVRRLA